MADDDFAMEAIPGAFGNGAHIVVPKELADENAILRIEQVADWTPPLFNSVDEGKQVNVEYVSDETEERQTVEGKVETIESDRDSTTGCITATMKFATELDEKKAESYDDDDVVVRTSIHVTITREPGEDGWEGEYELRKRTMVEKPFSDGDEENESASVQEILGGNDTRLGRVESLSVKHTVEP